MSEESKERLKRLLKAVLGLERIRRDKFESELKVMKRVDMPKPCLPKLRELDKAILKMDKLESDLKLAREEHRVATMEFWNEAAKAIPEASEQICTIDRPKLEIAVHEQRLDKFPSSLMD